MDLIEGILEVLLMKMRSISFVLILLSTFFSFLVCSTAFADICNGAADCQLQQQSQLNVNAWHTTGPAFSCTGDHSYADDYSYTTVNKSHFVVTRNPAAEGRDSSKLVVTITNFSFSANQLTFTLACYTKNPDSNNNNQVGVLR